MAEKGLLQNKIALVTGGGGGIGWGICTEFAKEGAKVVVTDIDDIAGQEVTDELSTISSGHTYHNLDTRYVKKFQSTVSQILKGVGDIDILVNHAGVNTPNDLLTMTEEAWDKVHETNLRGHVFLSQLIAKNLKEKNKSGGIIFTSSVHQSVVQGRPHYSSSKAAMIMLIKEMAVELASYNIRVNGIAPGGIYVSEKTDDPKKANEEPTVLLGGKNGIPQDIGRTAVFLASDYWSRHITGEIITVSGGQYLKPK